MRTSTSSAAAGPRRYLRHSHSPSLRARVQLSPARHPLSKPLRARLPPGRAWHNPLHHRWPRLEAASPPPRAHLNLHQRQASPSPEFSSYSTITSARPPQEQSLEKRRHAAHLTSYFYPLDPLAHPSLVRFVVRIVPRSHQPPVGTVNISPCRSAHPSNRSPRPTRYSPLDQPGGSNQSKKRTQFPLRRP